MQSSAFSIPFSLVLLGLGLGTAACGPSADASRPDPASPDAGADGLAGAANAGADGGAGPELSSSHVNAPAHWAPLGPSDRDQAGASGEDATSPTRSPSGTSTDRTPATGPDTTPPHIVSLRPPNGAVGVLADTPIIIEFSEPMARRETGDAFASETLPRAETEMSWNEAGTVLTLQPHRSLSYAHATLENDEALELRADTYGYTLTRFATDLAGNPLSETSVRFSTLREVTHRLRPVAELTGALRDQPPGALQPRWYGFVTFDASSLPSGIVRLERAVAELGPYGLNEPVPVFDVTFAQLSAAPTGSVPGVLVGTFASGASGALALPEPVRAFFIQTYLTRSDADRYAQFRLDLPASVAGVDVSVLDRALAATSLELDYLLP